jgi:hypothetical protein
MSNHPNEPPARITKGFPDLHKEFDTLPIVLPFDVKITTANRHSSVCNLSSLFRIAFKYQSCDFGRVCA